MVMFRLNRTTRDVPVKHTAPNPYDSVAELDDIDLAIANPVPQRPGADAQVARGLCHREELIWRHFSLLGFRGISLKSDVNRVRGWLQVASWTGRSLRSGPRRMAVSLFCTVFRFDHGISRTSDHVRRWQNLPPSNRLALFITWGPKSNAGAKRRRRRGHQLTNGLKDDTKLLVVLRLEGVHLLDEFSMGRNQSP
jgi:hypothetical protein